MISCNNIYLIVRYGFINFRLIYCQNIKTDCEMPHLVNTFYKNINIYISNFKTLS